MSLFGDLCIKKTKVAVVGLGYVGLPLAAAFAEKFAVIGFDRNERKIAAYEEGVKTGIASTVALLGQFNLTVKDGTILAMLAGAYATGTYDASSNESSEGKSDG